MKNWHLFYSEALANCETTCCKIEQQAVAQLMQIPWSHNLIIVSKSKDVTEALYYVNKTIECNWSRNVFRFVK